VSGRRVAAALCAGAVLVAQPAAASSSGLGVYWSFSKLMRRLDGTRVKVGGRWVRIHRETTLCSGIGRRIHRHGVRRWRRFECTYSIFLRAGLYDCEFVVVTIDARTLSVRKPRWVGGAP
jgi:hypothetical protein